ncbi:hypothetical protein BD779DRAFT_1469556 [Infundibulicybe gibba]|nr:hypothetical protein BD779DRAFT_1469556 [Infundibulicybe gibba]
MSLNDSQRHSGDIHISQRALALRKQVQEAFDNAGGEPADGNWGSVARLLRLGVTRGRYRWVGARRDASGLESSIGWINAQNETEWFEWEKRKQDEERVKQKVESWKKAVDVEAEPPSDLGPMDASIITINDTLDEPRVGRLRENAKTVTISATRTLQRVKATAKSAGNGRDPKDPSPLASPPLSAPVSVFWKKSPRLL